MKEMEELETVELIAKRLTPIKSVNDWNEYRIIILKNGLKALLISTNVIIYDANDASDIYYGLEGPKFLKHGATSRAKNLAATVFFPSKPTKNGDTSESSDPEPQEVEMTASGSDEEVKEAEGDSEEVEMAASGSDEEVEAAEDSEEVENTDGESIEDEISEDIYNFDYEDEFVQRLLDDDEEAVNIFLKAVEENEDFHEHNTELDTLDTLAVNLGYDLIPFELADIERSKDEAAKLVFPNSQTKTARNGVISITFPIGALSDHLSVIGMADLSRQILQTTSIISPETGFEPSMTTFTHLCDSEVDVDTCCSNLANHLENPEDTRAKLVQLMKSKYPHNSPLSQIQNGLDVNSWTLNDKKQLHLLYSLAKDNHPFKAVSPNFYLGITNNFPTKGNKFYGDLEESLKTLWVDKYCCHSATMVVQSSESLDNLESIIVKHVGEKVCDHAIQTDQEYDYPFDMETFAKLYRIAYAGVEPMLVMSWALSPAIWKNYKSKPMEFVSWLISHKSKGGLYSILQEKNWITDIQAGCNHTGYHRNDYMSLFQIKIKLTKFAVENYGIVRPVVKTVFSYLKFLDLMGVQNDTFRALYLSREVAFHRVEQESNALRNLQIPFSHPACPLPKIAVLGENMQMLEEEDLGDILRMDTFFNHSEDDIHNLLTSLDINTCNFMLSKENFSRPTDRVEVYYGTKYSMENVPSQWKVANDDVDLSPHFQLPDVLDSLTNIEPPLFDEEDFTPVMIQQDRYVNVWKKSNSNFKKVASYIMHIAAPLNYYSPDRAVMISIISKMLNERVKDLDVLALNNLHYSIEPTHIGILVKIFGLQNQCTQAFGSILENYKALITKTSNKLEPTIEELKESYFLALARSDILARCVYNTVSVRNYVPLGERLNALTDFSKSRCKNEMSLFHESYTTGLLALGCCSEEHTLELAEKLPRSHSGGSFGKTEILSYKWPVGHKIIRLVNNVEKENVYISQHFQLQLASPRNKAFANIFLQIVNTAIDSMKNKRNRVLMGARLNEFNSVLDFEIFGSALNTTADELEESIDHTMEDIHCYIEKSSETYKCEYRGTTTSLAITRSSGKSHNAVHNEFHEFENKIKDFTFAFDNFSKEGEMYNSLGRKEFLEWCSDNFDEKKRKLSIQIIPTPVNKSRKKKSKVSVEKVNPMTGYTIVTPGPGPRNKESEKFIENLEQYKGTLVNLYNPSATI